MKIINIICSVILTITLPVVSICGGFNLAGRLPDLYSYEMKATEVLNSISIEENEDQMGAFFSSYMTGKQETFQLTYLFGENTDNLFLSEEQGTMERYKATLDQSLVIGGIALLLALISYFLIYKQNLKQLLRTSLIRGVPVYLALSGCLLAAITVGAFRSRILQYLFPYEIKEFMVLPQLLPESYFLHLFLVSLFISLIIMSLIGYFTWKITKPRRIFGAAR